MTETSTPSDDPYKPPAEGPQPGAPVPVKKPVRVWLLQAQAGLPLIGATFIFPWMMWQGRIDFHWGFWIVELALKVALSALVIISLQRLTPRPAIVAPVVGLAWWAYVSYEDYLRIRYPVAGPLDEYKVQNVDSNTEILVALFSRGFWLVLALSLILHQRTRDYLAGRMGQVALLFLVPIAVACTPATAPTAIEIAPVAASAPTATAKAPTASPLAPSPVVTKPPVEQPGTDRCTWGAKPTGRASSKGLLELKVDDDRLRALMGAPPATEEEKKQAQERQRIDDALVGTVGCEVSQVRGDLKPHHYRHSIDLELWKIARCLHRPGEARKGKVIVRLSFNEEGRPQPARLQEPKLNEPATACIEAILSKVEPSRAAGEMKENGEFRPYTDEEQMNASAQIELAFDIPVIR